MKLISSEVINFRSIENSGVVKIEGGVTVLVGQNESGKTSFLQALDRCNSVKPLRKFDKVEDYPRRFFTKYLREKTADNSPVVVTNTFVLSKVDIANVAASVGYTFPADYTFSVSYKFDGGKTVGLPVDEAPFVQSILKQDSLNTFRQSSV